MSRLRLLALLSLLTCTGCLQIGAGVYFATERDGRTGKGPFPTPYTNLIVGTSGPMRRVYEQIARVASTNTTAEPESGSTARPSHTGPLLGQ